MFKSKWWWMQEALDWQTIQRLEATFNIRFTDKTKFVRMDYMDDYVTHKEIDQIPVRVSGGFKIAAAPDGTIYFSEGE